MPRRGQRDRRDQRRGAQPAEDQVEHGRPEQVLGQPQRPGHRGRRDHEEHRGGRPARRPRVGDGSAQLRDRAPLVQPRPDGHHRERHPYREPREVPRRPHAETGPVPRPEHQHRVREGQGAVRADGDQQPLRAHPHVRAAGAQRPPAEDGRRRGQQQVPADLDGEAPELAELRRAERRPPLVRDEGLGEGEQRGPRDRIVDVAAPERRHVDEDEHPEGGKDPQRPLPQVRPGSRLRPAVQHRGRPRPVQQQPGQHEEDGHPELPAVEKPARPVRVRQRPRVRGDVVHQHGERGDRPQAVEGVLMTRDRGSRDPHAMTSRPSVFRRMRGAYPQVAARRQERGPPGRGPVKLLDGHFKGSCKVTGHAGSDP